MNQLYIASALAIAGIGGLLIRLILSGVGKLLTLLSLAAIAAAATVGVFAL